MKLNSGEHALLGNFPSRRKAERAAFALRKSGFTQVQVDRISRFGTAPDQRINDPARGQAYTQSALIFHGGAERFNREAGILTSADPSVSGNSTQGGLLAGGKAFLVTVVVTEDKIEEARLLMEQAGGEV